MERNYKSGTTRVNVQVDAQQVTIELTCVNVSQIAQWSSEWQNVWQVDLSSKKFTGSMKLLVHYYEGGNFFQRVERQIEADLKEVDARTIIEKISEVETD